LETLFFVVSKMIGVLLRADTWIMISLAGIIVLIAMERRRLALGLSGFSLCSLLMLSLFPVGDLLLQPIERQYPQEPLTDRVDGIIILGGGEDVSASAYWGKAQLSEGADRYTASLALARSHPEARLLFTGGGGSMRGLTGETVSEASVAESFFLSQGIERERLLLENKSRNTSENARLGLSLASPRPGETWILVTSAFHMPRAVQSFENAGWTGIVAWPVDYRASGFVDGFGWNLMRNLTILNIAVHEWAGRLVYAITGK
jgi:uncharacterized SAM-binding protein YcdF (DUF218 family)